MLSRAVLRRAELRRAVLRRAVLGRAELSRAVLRGGNSSCTIRVHNTLRDTFSCGCRWEELL